MLPDPFPLAPPPILRPDHHIYPILDGRDGALLSIAAGRGHRTGLPVANRRKRPGRLTLVIPLLSGPTPFRHFGRTRTLGLCPDHYRRDLRARSSCNGLLQLLRIADRREPHLLSVIEPYTVNPGPTLPDLKKSGRLYPRRGLSRRAILTPCIKQQAHCQHCKASNTLSS